MTADNLQASTSSAVIAGGLRAAALALRGPPPQFLEIFNLDGFNFVRQWEFEDSGVKVKLGLDRFTDILGFTETVTFGGKRDIRKGDMLARKASIMISACDGGTTLSSGLEENHRTRQPIRKVSQANVDDKDPRPRETDHKAFFIIGIRTCACHSKAVKIGDAIVARSRCKNIVKHKRAKRRVSSGTSAANRHSFAIDKSPRAPDIERH